MAASNSILGFGTQFQMGDGGGTEVFTTVAEVRDMTGPGLSMDTSEVTHHQSPGAWKEFVAGLLDAGEVSFDIGYVPTGATHNASTGLVRDMKNRTKRNFKVIFPDVGATTWAFAGFVTGFEPGEPVNDSLTASVTIKVTGQPTLV